MKTRRQETVKISSKNKFSVRLIGAPFTTSDEVIDTREDPCYQHLEFQGFEPGTYEFSMSINTKTDQLKFVCISGTRSATFRDKLCYSVGQNCVLCENHMEAKLEQERAFMEGLCGADPDFVPHTVRLAANSHRRDAEAVRVLQNSPNSPVSPASSRTATGDDDCNQEGTPRSVSRMKNKGSKPMRRLNSSAPSISKLSSLVTSTRNGISKIQDWVSYGPGGHSRTPALQNRLRSEDLAEEGPSSARDAHAVTAKRALSILGKRTHDELITCSKDQQDGVSRKEDEDTIIPD